MPPLCGTQRQHIHLRSSTDSESEEGGYPAHLESETVQPDRQANELE